MSAVKSAQRSFVFNSNCTPHNKALDVMNSYYLKDETDVVNELLELAKLSDSAQQRVQDRARLLVQAVRKNQSKKTGIEAFLQQYDLSSEEGIILMCLAEALLRIPDSHTADKLIRDKLSEAKWENI